MPWLMQRQRPGPSRCQWAPAEPAGKTVTKAARAAGTPSLADSDSEHRYCAAGITGTGRNTTGRKKAPPRSISGQKPTGSLRTVYLILD